LLKSNPKSVNYPGIGVITYKRNLRARRLSISVKSSSKVKVTIPGTLSLQSAESFVLTKSKWIIEKVEYFSTKETKLSQSEGYKTKEHTLQFISADIDKIHINMELGKINLYYPNSMDIANEKVQQVAIKGIEQAFRLEAQNYLPNRVKQLASQFGYKYAKVGINKASTRWGSCSPKNNINLSLYLMKLPNNLIDYIILHELCHTLHKNHGPRFWAELNRLTEGNAKQLSKEVKKYRAGI